MSLVNVEIDCLSGDVCFCGFFLEGRSGKSSELVSMRIAVRDGLGVVRRGPRARSTDCVGLRLPMRAAR